MKRMIIAAAVLAASAGVAHADCRYEAPRAISAVDTSGISTVRVITGAGSLEVTGRTGGPIEATGTACASNQNDLEDIRLVTRKRGQTLEIEAEIPDQNRSWGRSARMDVRISLPDSIELEIEDGSGSIEIRNTGDTRIDDGSGSITVHGARSLWIDDGSGDIDIENIAGLVEIEDGSGDIDIRDVRNTVRILDDGSGGIDIKRVTGNVIIDDDGSGGIYVTEVGGDLVVGDHGSGGLSFDRINGKVSVRD